MSKAIRLGMLLALLGLAAVAAPTSAQQRCAGDTGDATIVDGTVNCRVVSGRGVGLAADREKRVIRAAEVSDPSSWTSPRVGLCLRGTGALIRIPTAATVRQGFWAFPVQGAAGYTCTVLDSAAIVILLEEEYPSDAFGGAAPAATPATGSAETTATTGTGTAATTGTGTAAGSSTPRFTLDSCTVVTTAILNFRSGPSLNDSIKGLIPYNIALRAIDRQGDWYNVIYEDDNGWITATRVRTRGNCGR